MRNVFYFFDARHTYFVFNLHRRHRTICSRLPTSSPPPPPLTQRGPLGPAETGNHQTDQFFFLPDELSDQFCGESFAKAPNSCEMARDRAWEEDQVKRSEPRRHGQPSRPNLPTNHCLEQKNTLTFKSSNGKVGRPCLLGTAAKRPDPRMLRAGTV